MDLKNIPKESARQPVKRHLVFPKYNFFSVSHYPTSKTTEAQMGFSASFWFLSGFED